MGFIIGLLTFMMVLDCVVLVLLVLIQLPKKDAGAGLAFGGGATDALFGAGSGTVLTRVTKYAATISSSLPLCWRFCRATRRTDERFRKEARQPGGASATMPRPDPRPRPRPPRRRRHEP